jgi:penicillin-binding protein 1A
MRNHVNMKQILILFALLAGLGGSLALAAGGYIVFDVVAGDYSQFSRQRILEILSKETVVYFSDGETQVGSLFGNEHRQYVTIHEIPKSMQDAVIAAEDGDFYKHHGVDFVSTMRAAMVNVLFNRREGASTITQQTVKNLFGRPITNLRAKYVEAINAFKLERTFTKDEILEFYLNQFHVTGNGRGVGVAAKYYFNKNVADLSIVESAFIAGSVKGPDLYNPFTKKSVETRARAIRRAMDRKNYVIKRMLELGLVSAEEAQTASAASIPFVQGKFQFNQLSVIDMIKGQINRKEVLEALGAENVDQIASMGLKITTTLSKNVQEQAQYAVRQNLSRLATILQGFSIADNRQVNNQSQLTPLEFYVGKVNAVDTTKGAEGVRVGLGMAQCQIGPEGIDRMAKFMDHGRYRGVAAAKAKLLERLTVGTPVLVSVKKELVGNEIWSHLQAPTAEPTPPTAAVPPAATAAVPEEPLHTYLCDLETPPLVSGGAIVLDKGEILAAVGGFSPHEYNRAVYARRQPGSTFKTLTYYAALHMGWHALAPLINVRDAYEWQSQFYYPRPDHPPKTLTTTLVGAGSFSENLASVWLMAHLTKKLSPSQFLELLRNLEVIDGTEDETALAVKMRDKFNVGFGASELAEGVFDSLIDDYGSQFEVVSDRELFVHLATMNAGGPRYDKELEKVRRMGERALPSKERLARVNMLRNTLHRWRRLEAMLTKDLEQARQLLGAVDPLSGDSVPSALAPVLSRFRLGPSGRLSYFGENDAFDPTAYSQLMGPLEWQPFDVATLAQRVEGLLQGDPGDFGAGVWLDGRMPAGLVRELAASFDTRLVEVANLPLRERLQWNFDLRYSAGMLFARNMVQEMGVVSKVEWVPSFPLGTNDVSLAELAMTYQTLLNGETYQFYGDGAVNQLSLLKRIEDSNGSLLWESTRSSRQVFEKFYTPSILSILRGTVTSGTARIAHGSVMLDGGDPEADEVLRKARIRVPTFGKTGTTNDYTNATYVGFLPVPPQEGAQELALGDAVTIAAYVGYDNNKPMRRPGVRIAGGTGALPAWIDIAKAVIRDRGYSEALDWKTITERSQPEVPFDYGEVQRLVVPHHGAALDRSSTGDDADPNATAAEVDLNVFHDDYAEASEGSMVVHLPGRVDKGTFSPQTKVSFLQARDGVIMPGQIPELNEGAVVDPEGTDDSVDLGDVTLRDAPVSLPEPPSEGAQGSGGERRAGGQDAGEQGSTQGYDFLIPPPPPAPAPGDEVKP